MSTFAVKVCKIKSIMKHPNADKLDLVTLEDMDWQVVTAKDQYNIGSLVIYFPIDSILPEDIELKIFGLDSKIKLHNHRIRTIKLRGAISQGMIVNPNLFGTSNYKLGTDLTKQLNITKYEVVVKTNSATKSHAIKKTNSNFRKYTGIENAKNYNNIFQEGEQVFVTEKIHGSNFRAGWVPTEANTWFKKLKRLFKLLPKYEFVYGSHNVELTNKLLYKGYYESNIYAEMVNKYNLKTVLGHGEVVYGEVYGDAVQGNYTYGCKKGERKLVFFELHKDGTWLEALATKKFYNERSLPFVPSLYVGPFNKEKILSLKDGPSVLCPEQKIREGCVVRSLKEEQSFIGRKMLKFISDAYLLKNQDSEEIAH